MGLYPLHTSSTASVFFSLLETPARYQKSSVNKQFSYLWNTRLQLKSPSPFLTTDLKDIHPGRPDITSPKAWFIGRKTWRWRQAMVRLKAESPSTTKAYGRTCCHSLQILQSISQEKGFKELMCLCMGVLDIRGNLFPVKTVKHWKRLPREVAQSPSLEVFKTLLDEALSNVVWPRSWPCFEHEIGLETSWGSFSLSYPMIQISLLLTDSHLSPMLPARHSLLPHPSANPSGTLNLTPAWQEGTITTLCRAVPPAEADAASRLPDSTKCCWVWCWFPHCQHTESRGEKAFLKSRQVKWWELQPDKKHIVRGLEAAGFLVQAFRHEGVFNA